MTTFTTSQPSSLFLEMFQLGTLLPIMSILEFLDEPSLSNMTCAMLGSHDANDKDWSMQLTQCFDEAWIRLAVRKCRKSSNSRADCNKGFPTAKIAKTFLRVQQKRISKETMGCANRGCPHSGKFRCSACKVAMYCSRKCQTEDWRHHKPACKHINKKAEEFLPSLHRNNLVFCPWGPHVCDIKERKLTDCRGVYAEYDPKTFEIRAFGSALSLREAIEEKRLHNDGIFYQIINLCDCFLNDLDGDDDNNNEVFWRAFEELHMSIVDYAPDECQPLAVLRAIEGVIAKTNVPGNKKESFHRLKELVEGDE